MDQGAQPRAGESGGLIPAFGEISMARYDIPLSEFDVADAKFAIVAARFNDEIVSPLLEAALDTFAHYGSGPDEVLVVRVPGAFELPLAARWIAQRGAADAIVALGAVIRGDTPHFDYVCAEAARGLQSVSIEDELPVIFGVLTCDSRPQAHDRSGGERGNKGREAALAALDMVSQRRRLHALIDADVDADMDALRRSLET